MVPGSPPPPNRRCLIPWKSILTLSISGYFFHPHRKRPLRRSRSFIKRREVMNASYPEVLSLNHRQKTKKEDGELEEFLLSFFFLFFQVTERERERIIQCSQQQTRCAGIIKIACFVRNNFTHRMLNSILAYLGLTQVGVDEDSFAREFSTVRTFVRCPIKFAKPPIFQENLENRGRENPVF